MATDKNVPPARPFAVLLAPAGSITFGATRIPALQATPVPAELKEKVDTTVNPVQFFDTEEAAQKKVAELRAKAEAAAKPKK